MDWIRLGQLHNSSHLFARLPFGDAIRLAALAGTGQMTWAEIDAALDAKIKLAIEGLRPGQRERPAPADLHATWEEAKRAGEDEIWARYHATCDAVFAGDTADDETDPWSQGELRHREQILNRLRSERDRALAALSRRIGPPPPRQAAPQNPAMRGPSQLAATELDALRKLDASGFVGSQIMTDAIHDLAVPLAGTNERSA